MSSPWAKIPVPEPSSLKNIMLEEITKEKTKCFEETDPQSDVNQEQFFDLNTDENLCDPDTDAVIAKILQQDYDEEYSKTVTTKEKQTYTSMFIPQFVKIDLYQVKQSDISENNPDQKELEDIDEENLQHSDKVIFKYDFKLNEGINNGNSLKLYSKCEQSKREKLHDTKEDNATAGFALDHVTRLQFHKLINKQVLRRINGVISVRKEAIILHGNCDPSYSDAKLPKKCVIKVYKATLADLMQRENLGEDKHFIGKIGKQSIKKNINLWAEKEFCNLSRLQAAGIPCPQPIALKKHVLVMSFIGDRYPAPELKYAAIKSEELELAFNQVVKLMKKLYNKAGLIHGDLSEYNILWHNKQCYIIDVSQCVEPINTDAFSLLLRDCVNITEFFSSKKTPNMKYAQDLFLEITGFYSYYKVEMEEAISKFTKSKPNDGRVRHRS